MDWKQRDDPIWRDGFSSEGSFSLFLSLARSLSVRQHDSQLKLKLWLTAADLWVKAHDRGSLGSGSLFQKRTQEEPVWMCVRVSMCMGIFNRLSVLPTTPHTFTSTSECTRFAWSDRWLFYDGNEYAAVKSKLTIMLKVYTGIKRPFIE